MCVKTQNFWPKIITLTVFLLILCTFWTAGFASYFYARSENKASIQNLQAQTKKTKQQLWKDLRYLISDLTALQTGPLTPRSSFSILAVIDTKSKKIEQVRPQSFESKIRRLKGLPFEDLKNASIAFYQFQLSARHKKRVALMVNVNQIKAPSLPAHLSRGKILFGLLSPIGLARFTSSLGGEGLPTAFILDKNWFPGHSNNAYSGQYLPSQSMFRHLKTRHPRGWTVQTQEALSTAMPLGLSRRSYIVLNQKPARWTDYFSDILGDMAFIFCVLGALLIICLFWITHPIVSAYEYAERLIHRYAIWNSFPIPEQASRNVYIQGIQSNLKKIFWRHREKQLAEAQYLEPQYFSSMIQQLTQQIKEKHPGIQINLSLDSEVKLSHQQNWLEQSVFEVLKNAVESMKYKGQIDIQSFAKEGILQCIIRDYGPGMSPSVLSQAQEAYYSTKKQSVGLGLTLAGSALSRMGGRLSLTPPTDGKGGLSAQISVPMEFFAKTEPSIGVSP